MPSVLLITDNTTHQIGAPRYLGPYRVAHALEEAGIKTYVMDSFYQFDNFFELMENFLNDDFVAIGLSTTFLTPKHHHKNVVNLQKRRERMDNYFSMGVIHPDANEVQLWFDRLEDVIQRKCPRAKIFAGGAKAWMFMHGQLSQIKGPEYLVLGAADMVFPQVIKDLMKEGQPQFVVRNGKKIVDTLSTYVQPKACPAHDWKPHWLVDYQEALPIEIGRGCAFNCKFCSYDKNRSDRKSLENLRSELISNYENYGTQFYHFADDCFNDNRHKVEEVCRLIKSLPFKIEWVSYARFDVAVRFPETARMMIEAGAKGLYFGIESLTYEVARRAGKGTHPDKIKEFMKSFYQDFGDQCLLTGSFISGLPGETRDSWMREVDWMIENPSLHFVNVGSLQIAPYVKDLDQKITDYADYARDPQKYGFEEIRFAPSYWRHSTMDLPEAESLAQVFIERWREVRRGNLGVWYDIWVYPHFRSLGLSEAEARAAFFSEDPVVQQQVIQKLTTANAKRWARYRQRFEDLCPRPSLSLASPLPSPLTTSTTAAAGAVAGAGSTLC